MRGLGVGTSRYRVDVEVWGWRKQAAYDRGEPADHVETYDIEAETPEQARDRAEALAVKNNPNSDTTGLVFYPIVRGTAVSRETLPRRVIRLARTIVKRRERWWVVM